MGKEKSFKQLKAEQRREKQAESNRRALDAYQIERRRVNQRNYYYVHREERCAHSRAWYLKNKERVKEYNREYYLIHPEKKENHKIWEMNNSDKVKEKNRRFHLANPKYFTEYSRNHPLTEEQRLVSCEKARQRYYDKKAIVSNL